MTVRAALEDAASCRQGVSLLILGLRRCALARDGLRPAQLVRRADDRMPRQCRITAKVIAELRGAKIILPGQDHTMRSSVITGITFAALAGLTPAAAQTMIGVPSPALPSSAPADAAAAPEATAPKPTPKQKGPPGALTVVNASAKTVTEVAITAGDKTATLSKPLAPKGRTAV